MINLFQNTGLDCIHTKQALLICGPYSASMRQRPQPCTYSEVVSPSVTQWNSIDLLYSDGTSHDIY